MAKKKKSETYDPNAVHDMMEAAWEAWNHGLDPAEAAASSVGLYLPHLCLRYLFQSNILPFGRTVLTLGPTGSNKTAFVYALYDLFRRNNGKYLHYDVEDKDTPVLRLSLTGYDRKAGRMIRCESMDHFQREVKIGYDHMKAICAKGIGKRIPFICGVDSLTAKMTDDAYEAMAKKGVEGAAKRRFADEARSLSDWFKVVSNYLYDWPFVLVGIRHDKPTKDQWGNDKHEAPGGKAPKYYASYDILQTKVKKLKADKTEGWEGNRIKFALAKSSLGSDQRWFEAEIAWRPTERMTPSGNMVSSQDTVWMWHKATVELLYYIQMEGGPAGRAVEDLIGLGKATGNRYTSSTLGVRGEEALSPSEMGRLIEACPDLLKALEPKLGIGSGNIFDPAPGLDAQLASARASVDDYIAAPYELVEGVSEEIPTNSETEEEPDSAS